MQDTPEKTEIGKPDAHARYKIFFQPVQNYHIIWTLLPAAPVNLLFNLAPFSASPDCSVQHFVYEKKGNGLSRELALNPSPPPPPFNPWASIWFWLRNRNETSRLPSQDHELLYTGSCRGLSPVSTASPLSCHPPPHSLSDFSHRTTTSDRAAASQALQQHCFLFFYIDVCYLAFQDYATPEVKWSILPSYIKLGLTSQ